MIRIRASKPIRKALNPNGLSDVERIALLSRSRQVGLQWLLSNCWLAANLSTTLKSRKILRPDGPEADTLAPPRAYNCRSILSPVLRTEGPVEYITDAEIARGRELSGVGFADPRLAKAGGLALEAA